MTATRVSNFVRLMKRWESLWPYNAAQAMRLEAGSLRIDPDLAWRRVWRSAALDEAGLTSVGAVERPEAGLDQAITDALNRRFVEGDAVIRPFVVDSADGCHCGILYRHCVADSVSIRLLMKRWFDALRDQPSGGPIKVLAPTRRPTWYEWFDLAAREVGSISRAKRVRRLPRPGDASGPVRFEQRFAPAGLIDRLVEASRRHGVKVNDAFLAAAAIACGDDLPLEVGERRDIAVGTIVDLRRDADRHRFGLSLGFTQTYWRWHDLRDPVRAARIASTQSHRSRATNAARASDARLGLLLRYMRGLDDRNLTEFYRKRTPMVAGISNVNLNRDWPARHYPRPLLGYVRASPLGPTLPIVFTPTTLGSELSIGVTHRPSVVSPETLNAIVADFFAALMDLVG